METYFGFLTEVGQIFAEAPDAGSALANTLRMAVPRLGDWCAVHQVDEFQRVTGASLAYWEASPGGDPQVRVLAFQGEGAFREIESLGRTLGMESSRTLALKARGRVLGALHLGVTGPGGFAGEQDLLAEEFARCLSFGLECLSARAESRRLTRGLKEAEEGKARAEAALKQGQDLLGLLVGSFTDHVLMVEVDAQREYRVAFADPIHAQSFEARRRNWKGRPLEELLPENQAETYRRRFDEVVRAGRPTESTHVSVLNPRIWLHTRMSPVRDAHGLTTHLLCVSRDITDLKRAEEEVQSTRDLLALALDKLHDSVFVAEPSGRLLYLNQAAVRTMGAESREAAARESTESLFAKWILADESGRVLKPSDQPAAQALAGLTPERKLVRGTSLKTGREHWWELQATPQLDAEGKVRLVVLNGHEVTRQKALQENLRRALQEARTYRDLLKSTLDALPDQVGVYDPESRLLYANQAMAAMLEAEPRENRFKAPLERLPGHLELFDEAGRRVDWADIPLARALRGESSPNRQLRRRDLRTGRDRWEDMRAVPIRNVRGELALIVTISHDITQRRQVEQDAARIREERDRVGRGEALRLAAGAFAHDFNNLLTTINGFAELLAARLAGTPDLLEYAEEIQGSGERGARLTQMLLAYTRQQVLRPRVVEAEAIVRSLEDRLASLAGARIRLILRSGRRAGRIRVDPAHWEQALLALATNACEAMPNGGELIIRTDRVRVDAEEAAEEGAVAPGEYVQLEVSDTGHGMSEETLARVFEPFFSTKGLGKGTGLGLSMAQGMVKQSGGHIQVQSRKGAGTTVRVLLPPADSVEAPGLSPS